MGGVQKGFVLVLGALPRIITLDAARSLSSEGCLRGCADDNESTGPFVVGQIPDARF